MSLIAGLDEFESNFLEELVNDIAANKIILPSLPDVALKIREAVNDDRADANMIAKILATDAAISARLLKVSNSLLYNRGAKISDLKAAVSRLGLNLVKTLVFNMSLMQMLRPHKGLVSEYLESVKQHSMEVAAVAYALASRYTKLDPNQAMFAGLIHDIGYLPILDKAAVKTELLNDKQKLKNLLYKLHPVVGANVLSAWNFSPEFIHVVKEHENLLYDSKGKPDYVDILIVANLAIHHGNDHPLSTVDRETVPAFHALGVTPGERITDDEETASLIEKARQSLSI